jgi:uncharacterized protein YbjT (DUF2867 family)
VEYTLAEGDSATVNEKSVLVLGATGTLGRQVVRQFLAAGYNVRCFIRNRADRPFSFLVDWGATVVEGSLIRSESLPSSLIGVHTVIDCSTARPEESCFDVDWEGKKTFIQCCEKMEIQRYIFMSIKDCDKYPNVPLMNIKYMTEQLLQKSSMRHTILRTTGFFQPLIAQYATSILDDQEVWSDDNNDSGIAYIDSLDCARMITAAANKESTVGQTLTITGPKAWSAPELIELCENLSGKRADVKTVNPLVMQATAGLAKFSMWGVDIAERLQFAEVSQGSSKSDVMTDATYATLGMDKGSVRNLDEYIGEYYRRIMKMLTVGSYSPDSGEVEKEQADSDAKLKQALSKDDKLPAGQPEMRPVSVVAQRQTADRLQKYFEDKILTKMDSKEYDWFGLTPVAEVVNGRAAMFGFSLGLFTEWATDVSVARQIQQLIDIFSPQ